jgi:hypothetical protein
MRRFEAGHGRKQRVEFLGRLGVDRLQFRDGEPLGDGIGEGLAGPELDVEQGELTGFTDRGLGADVVLAGMIGPVDEGEAFEVGVRRRDLVDEARELFERPDIEWRGRPEIIRVDNGPEYISGKLMAWAGQRNILLTHIQPGKPQQNAYVERYNRTVRLEWLGRYMFDSIREVQDYATEWLWTYNNERPNMGIGE